MQLLVDITLAQLISQLSNELSNENIFDLIVLLEKSVAEEELLLRLYKHFKGEVEKIS